MVLIPNVQLADKGPYVDVFVDTLEVLIVGMHSTHSTAQWRYFYNIPPIIKTVKLTPIFFKK